MLWLRISKKSGGSSGPSSRPNQPRPFSPMPQFFRPRPMERRIIPSSPSRPMPPRPKSGAQRELDEVLRKLKEMGK